MTAVIPLREHTVLLDDGARVHARGGQAEIRDAEGRLLVRYVDGTLQIQSAGDIDLAAPDGEVRIRGRAVAIDAKDELTADAPRVRLTAGVVTTLARDVSVTAERIAEKAERYELYATRVVERAQDVFRHATGLLQQRAQELHAYVDDTFSLRSRRTELSSEDDTAIDGKRVLLG